MRLRNLTFGTKILFSFAALAAMLALTAVYGFRAVGSLQSALDQSAGITTRRIQVVGAVDIAISNMAASQRRLILYTYAKDPARATEAKDLFHRSQEQLQKAVADLRPLLVADESQQAA